MCTQLQWHLPKLARNLAGAGLGWISEKWPDSGFARVEIWYKPITVIIAVIISVIIAVIITIIFLYFFYTLGSIDPEG